MLTLGWMSLDTEFRERERDVPFSRHDSQIEGRVNHHPILKGVESTPPKTNMDTQNDGLEKVAPFNCGNCWYLY